MHIVVLSSVIILTGNVNFTAGIHHPRYSSGTAAFLRTTHPEFNSSLNITTGATLYFVNQTSSNMGGAVYVEDGVISIGVKAMMHNVAAHSGGAVYVDIGVISIGVKAKVVFMHNVAANNGGAVFLKTGTITVGIDSNVVQWNLQTTDTLGAGVLSAVERGCPYLGGLTNHAPQS